MKFNEWNRIYEAFSSEDIDSMVDSVSSQLERELHRKFYVIPEIDKFTRPEEPVQRGYLVTDSDAKSMRLNFTENGELYSVDYWKANSDKPSITVYLNDLPFDRAVGKLIGYYKNPSSNELKEEQSELSVTKPAKEKEADKGIIKAQKDDEYEIQNPKEIFEDLKTYVDMVVDGDLYALLLTGQPGVGKTFLVTHELQEKGLKRNVDYFKFSGKTTAAGMYMILYKNNGKMIIFDDCDSVFKDENSVNVLKGALDTSKIREISWESSVQLKDENKRAVPKTFDFTGKVIFISNMPKKKIDSAIRSRSFVLEVALSKNDMLARMWELLDTVEMPSGIPISSYNRNVAMTLIVKAASLSDKVDLNLRTLVKAILIVNKIVDSDVALRLIKQQCTNN